MTGIALAADARAALRVLAQGDAPVLVTNLAKVLGRPRRHILDACRELEAGGLAERWPPRSEFRITAAGKSAARWLDADDWATP